MMVEFFGLVYSLSTVPIVAPLRHPTPPLVLNTHQRPQNPYPHAYDGLL